MKRIGLSLALTVSLLSINSNAGLWYTTKEYVNKAMFWKSKHLSDIDFEHIYPKALYKKSYFGFIITGAAVVTAGAFTYFTAGAGAPAAATGVSSVASWVAGGGAGSYMAGLSTIGSWFGGNAILGAAILNGISIGALGGTTSAFSSLSILGKIGVMASVTATGFDGVVYFKNPDTKKLEYRVRVVIPKDLGSKKTRELVDKIYDTKEKINDALKNDDKTKQKIDSQLLNTYNKNAIKLLKQNVNEKDNQEDLIVLGIIAWNNGEYELFDKAISKISTKKLDNKGFLYYLYALKYLYKNDIKNSKKYLEASIKENPYAVEPVILYINILGNQNFLANEFLIKMLINNLKKNYDSDKYATGYTLTSVYYRVATFYFINKKYTKAQEYYQKAYDNLSFFQKHFFSNRIKHIIKLNIANSLYAQNKKAKALEIYRDILDDIDKDNKDEIRRIKEQFMGNKV